MMDQYSLYITFRSNERPFSTQHEPYPKDRFTSDEDAQKWADGMREGLLGYDVTLLKNGQPIA